MNNFEYKNKQVNNNYDIQNRSIINYTNDIGDFDNSKLITYQGYNITAL